MRVWVFVLSAVVLLALVRGEQSRADKSVDHDREVRQTFTCSDDSECYPSDPVPTSLVECANGLCSCMDCFERGSNGRCTVPLPNCYFYNNVTLTCDDERRSQLVAFLLSIFLSGVGAANFYIGQNGLAGGQLAILAVLILVACFGICIPCCVMCCVLGDSDVMGSVFGVICFVFILIVVIGSSLAMFAWWIADAVIFGTNARDDGNGCPLKPF